MRAPRTTRILSFLLALVFCLYLVPTEALAAELRTGSGNSQNAYARDTTATQQTLYPRLYPAEISIRKSIFCPTGRDF